MKKNNRRKKLLINKKFQLRQVKYFIVYALLFSFFIVYTLLFNLLDNLSGDDMKVLFDSVMSFTFFFRLFLLIGILISFSIYLSNRIYGPIYRLKESFKKVGMGELDFVLKFRKNDELHDIANEFNKMLKSLRKNRSKDN